MFVRNGVALGSVLHSAAPGAEEDENKADKAPSPEPAPHQPPVVPEKQPEPEKPKEPPSLDDLLAKSEEKQPSG